MVFVNNFISKFYKYSHFYFKIHRQNKRQLKMNYLLHGSVSLSPHFNKELTECKKEKIPGEFDEMP